MSSRKPGRRGASSKRRPRSSGAEPKRNRAPRGLGGEQVEGRRAVVELLRAGRRRVRSVWVSTAAGADTDTDDVIDEIAELAGSSLRLVSPAEIEGAAHTDSPQGVVASADPLPEADLSVLLSEPTAFLVALDGVTDPRNLGAVVRCAETAGATGVVVPRHRSARFTPAAVKASAGAVEHIPIASVGGVPAALDQARRRGVWTVGLHEGGDTTIDALTVASEPLVLVLGAEGHGLSPLTARRCEVVVAIPMRGRIASLNVAAAACVACHEIARHRYG